MGPWPHTPTTSPPEPSRQMGWRWPSSHKSPSPLLSWDHPLDSLHIQFSSMDPLREMSVLSSRHPRPPTLRSTSGLPTKDLPPWCMCHSTSFTWREAPRKVLPHCKSCTPVGTQPGGPQGTGSTKPHLYPMIAQMPHTSLLPQPHSHPRILSTCPQPTLWVPQ